MIIWKTLNSALMYSLMYSYFVHFWREHNWQDSKLDYSETCVTFTLAVQVDGVKHRQV